MNYNDLTIICNQVCDVLDYIGMDLYIPKTSKRKILFCDICGSDRGMFLDKISKYVYCVNHLNSMSYEIDLDRLCIRERCTVKASYGHLHGESLFCSAHKEEGMINLKISTCVFPHCNNYAKYSYGRGRAIKYCFEHKYPGMTIKSKRICNNKNCNKLVHRRRKVGPFCVSCYDSIAIKTLRELHPSRETEF